MFRFAFRCALPAAVLTLAACAGPMVAENSQQLTKHVLSDDGLSELHAPAGWESRPNVVRSASIRLAGDGGNAILVVNSYLPGELKAASPAEFAATMADNLAEALDDGRASQPRTLTIGGRPAYEYVIDGETEGGALTYVSTVVAGEHAVHNLIGWTTREAYTGATHALHRMIATFRESAPQRQVKPRVELTFDWPERMDFTVRYHGKATKRAGSYELKGVYRNAVRPIGPNLLQVQTRVLRQDYVADNAGQTDYMQKVIDQIGSEVPDFLITREGEFVRVQDLSGFHKRMERALFQSLPAGEAGKSADLAQKLKATMSEEFLAAAVTDDWNRAIGGWVDSAYVVGEIYRSLDEYMAPALGQRNYPMEVTRQLVGAVPCSRDDNGSHCVQLIYSSRVSDPRFRDDMARFIESTVGPGVRLTAVEITRRTEVIADPRTLLPFRTTSTEVKTVTVTDATGKPVTNEDRQEMTAIYNYNEATAAR